MRLSSIGLVLAALAAAAPRAEAAPAPPALVELFTSEGCSSCPPAEALLGKLMNDNQGHRVYALEFHVDYWNHLGWKDRFSSNVYTKRQREYVRRFMLQGMYTPQMVVNGSHEFVGTDANAAREAILATPVSDVTPQISVTVNGNDLRVHCVVPKAPEGAMLYVAWAQSRAISSPNAGENNGVTLGHVNVVRDFQAVLVRQGHDTVIKLTRPEAEEGDVIAWVQQPNMGRVLGADSRRVAP